MDKSLRLRRGGMLSKVSMMRELRVVNACHAVDLGRLRVCGESRHRYVVVVACIPYACARGILRVRVYKAGLRRISRDVARDERRDRLQLRRDIGEAPRSHCWPG